MTALKITSVGNSAGVYCPKDFWLNYVSIRPTSCILLKHRAESSYSLWPYIWCADGGGRTYHAWRSWHLAKTGKMIESIWIDLRVTKAFRDRQIHEHGGIQGLCEEGFFLAAWSRPENSYHYCDPKPDISELAVAYGFGPWRKYPFND